MNEEFLRPGLNFARARMMEECAELVQGLAKSLKWGWLSVNPTLPESRQESNLAWVRREMLDVRAALDNLDKELDIDDGAR